MEAQTLEAVNVRFNEELQRQIAGTLSGGHTYRLGYAGSILQSASIPNLPIELQASRLSDKSMQENHPFGLSEIRDLPRAIQNPLAVFRSATRIGSFVIMTEIEHQNKNFVVALEANKMQGKIEVNSIRSIHYRNSNTHIANWIGEDLLEYAEKRRMVEWFSKQRYNSADVRKLFNHAAKIVQNFQNPKLPEGKTVNIVKATPSKRLKQALESIDETELITNKTQMNMKRTLTIAVLLTAAVCGWAQTHFPKNYNIDLGGGVNDAENYTPAVGVGYTFNNWFALYGRYSFATDKIEDGRLTYWEHTGEVYPSFTVLSYRDKWFVSAFAGIAYKHQRLLDIPTPSRDVTGHNFGGVAGVEGEWHFARFLSIFGGVSYRGLFFKEEPRYEPFANIGVRTSMRVFRKAGKRR
jgi:hypothetical protein